MAGLVPMVAAAACTTRPPRPPVPECRVIDFERAEVTEASSATGSTEYVLRVIGEKPSASQTVKLVPVTYIQKPEYWRIEVQACNQADAGVPAVGRYDESLILTGATGTRGIEVGGATTSQRFDIADAPAPNAPTPVGWWHVTGVRGGFTGGLVPLVPDSSISLEIRPNGTLGGRACNSYSASWKVDGRSMSIGNLGATRMACPPGIGDQENRYFSALRDTASWRFDRFRLILSDANGRDIITAAWGWPPRDADPRPPTTRPEPPTSRPEPPTSRPEPPTTRPEPPTSRPEPPTTRPEPPTTPPTTKPTTTTTRRPEPPTTPPTSRPEPPRNTGPRPEPPRTSPGNGPGGHGDHAH